MIPDWILGRRRFDVGCTIKVNNTFESLAAHVELDGDIAVQPADEVIVHGAPITVPYGESVQLRRQATVVRAGLLERNWTRLTGDFEFMELCEFSFSEETAL
ncbi:MAG: hypothetical protein AAGG72_04930 [Pseudomonadota bacterium]